MDKDSRAALAQYCLITMNVYGQHEARVERWVSRSADLSVPITAEDVRPLAEALREVLLRSANTAHLILHMLEQEDEG